MGCANFTSTNPACRTVTLIEPDSTLLGATSSGSTDRSLDERGDTNIPANATRVQVLFEVTKASDSYRFEYLYVDAIGLSNPADITVVLVSKNAFGFLVDLVGSPLVTGYVLRWRVVVIDLTILTDTDAPESLRIQLPVGIRFMEARFLHPRSGTTYGLSEFRVENLIDNIVTQRLILPQVVIKNIYGVGVALSAPADTANYYLVVRSP